jgi:hypothetical protein
MGNDVYTYNWRVSYQGTVTTPADSSGHIEHRYADGAAVLMLKVLRAAWG